MRLRLLWVLPCLALGGTATAHSFAQAYTLPIPMWAYSSASAATLILSFLLVGLFMRARTPQGIDGAPPLVPMQWQVIGGRALAKWAGILSALLFALAVVAGMWGTRDVRANFNVAYFWIIFYLGITYASALVGNIYQILNPWRAVVEFTERLAPGFSNGIAKWPERWAYYPALLLYMGFIWLELFGHLRPAALSYWLLAYTVVNVGFVFLYGKDSWFKYGEFFSVLFSLISKISPLELRRSALPPGLILEVRRPFAGLLQGQATHLSELLFIFFMLSSTAFDGFRETSAWMGIYWKTLHHLVLTAFNLDLVASYPAFQRVFRWYETLAMLLSPLVYCAFYLLVVWVASRLIRASESAMETALKFAYTLLPIAFAYNLTHYYTLFLGQGPVILRLLSDPFGRGWNLLGTKGFMYEPQIEIGTIWHTQVWLIVLGHVASVYLAHSIALRSLNRRDAVFSQMPILLLMIAFTISGLWILSLPIQSANF